ncbi:hypothetical protein DSO57_1011342 [Entomophthora muscae]|uniref:Uncharacterized protein n=1 Tax=Entomophthora muscae TaxID=34485 RepID=A0ACC2U4M3_9FUNG|nr:hypothetical protein DSO57_1011342 [Entomophthora muscae]
MKLPVIKFVVFSVAPFFLLLWLTSPDLWSKISSSAWLMSEDPSSLLNLPGGLLYSREAVVKSLICDDLDLGDADYASFTPVGEEALASPFPNPEESSLTSFHAPAMSPPAPTCTPWLLAGLVLMALNAYLPQLSTDSSLWSPLQAAVPVLQWAASWWFVLQGWKTNLVSLAHLSHTPHLSCCFILPLFLWLPLWCCFLLLVSQKLHQYFPNFKEITIMILPVLKFVAFSLAPFLLLLWSTLPDLWSKTTSSAWLVGENPSFLLNFPSGLLLSGEAVVKSLTCNNLDLDAVGYALPSSEGERIPTPPLPSWEESDLVPLEAFEVLPPLPPVLCG